MSSGVSQIAKVSAQNAVSSLNAAATGTANTQQSSLEKNRKTIAQNFDAFLSLLTTQLKNQSPLDPLDANQFTQQLVQFSSVEQQLKTNDLLSGMSNGLGGGGAAGNGKLNAASAASLLGSKVSVDGGTQKLSKTALGATQADFPVTIQSNYSNYEVSIANEKGEEIFRAPWVPAGNGEQTFSWNGVRSNGLAADPAGKYTISVVGETTTGLKSKMSNERTGIVNSVDLSGSEEMVQFGEFTLPLSKVKKVSKATL
ncbi:MAG: flagellar hook assembly protein FlgD [Beijerinckiaceae bacterium]